MSILLISCTMAVYEKNKESFISLIKPTVLLYVTSNTKLESMGKEIKAKLIEVIEQVKWFLCK